MPLKEGWCRLVAWVVTSDISDIYELVTIGSSSNVNNFKLRCGVITQSAIFMERPEASFVAFML